jgi:hypothetical protein
LRVAFAFKSANKIALQKTHYAALRKRFGLSAQMAVRCISEVCGAYKRDKSIRPRFRSLAAVPYDQRISSFKSLDRVSLLTLAGRILVPFVMGKYQRGRFTASKGQCDLVRRKDGRWFLLVTVDLPEDVRLPASDFIGVDFGVVNIATTSDGTQHSGAAVEACRSRYSCLRRSLQQAASAKVEAKVRPKNIRRKLKAISSRESRFPRDVNHCISKTLVAHAKDTGCGIAGEDLNVFSRPHSVSQATTSPHVRLGLLPASGVPDVQGYSGRRRPADGRPTRNVAHLQPVRVRSEVQPEVASRVRVRQVRSCRTRRYKRGAEHPIPGACQRAHSCGIVCSMILATSSDLQAGVVDEQLAGTAERLRLQQQHEPALSRLARRPASSGRRFDRHGSRARSGAALHGEDSGQPSDRSVLVSHARAARRSAKHFRGCQARS